MQITISRIIIFGRDIDLLKHFYADNFNLRVIEEIPGEWVVLNAGAVEIALHKIGEAYTDDMPKVNNIKLVFTIPANLKQLRQKLTDSGVALKDIRSFPGINSIFCDGEDPEGNVFQLEERILL